jgi:transcriptional regulator with XRE-family HTH domain
MATNEVPRGPISGHVVENVKRLREEMKLSLADLSDAMSRAGRPMLASGLHRLEAGKRRVDADDLVALALALHVSPLTLLLPWTETGTVALTNEVSAEATVAWNWARGVMPLEVPDDWDEAQYATLQFQLNAVPKGFRLGSARPGTREYDDAKQARAEEFSRRRTTGGTDGEHQATP